MVRYLPYNPSSIVHVEEILTVADRKIFLRHIPKEGSIVIDGFTETDSLSPAPNQFSCQYALDSMYRDANRVLNFNAEHNGQSLDISYIAVGTVFTAEDANEIKEHLENQDIHAAIDAWEYKGKATASIHDSDGSDHVEYVETTSPDYPDEKDFAFFEFDSEFGSGANKYFIRDYLYYDTQLTCNPLLVCINREYYLLERIEAVVEWRKYVRERITTLEGQARALQSFTNALEARIADLEARVPSLRFIPYRNSDTPAPLILWREGSEYGAIIVAIDAIEERQTALDNDEDINEDYYEGNYTLVTRKPSNPDVDQIFYLGSEWGEINPLLTVQDRKLLDYLHEQFDDQIPY